MFSRSLSILDYYLNKLGMLYIPNDTYQVPRSSAFGFWSRISLKRFDKYGYVGHLGSVTKKICIHFRKFIVKSFHMKFEFHWPYGFCESYVLIYS